MHNYPPGAHNARPEANTRGATTVAQTMVKHSPADCISEGEFRLISNLIYRHCGINLHDGKKELVRARLAKRLREGSFTSFSNYIDHALHDSGGSEFSSLVDALTTNTTSFFREQQHFTFLQKTLLPTVIEAKRRIGDNKIRIWSAGCSSGEEPYSLAITLSEMIPDPAAWDIKILATDICTRMLDRCRTAQYAKHRMQSMPPQLRQKYTNPVRAKGEIIYEISPEISRMIRFRHLNLMGTWPFKGPFDFVFCRNVMIYFDKDVQGQLIERFWQVLPTGGMLFVGHSESLTGIKHRFQYVQPTIYARA